MRAQAELATECSGGRGLTRVATLRSQAPLMLRLTRPKEAEPQAVSAADAARVCVAAGAAGPIGGDEYTLHVDVGAGSTLVLGDISATLLLPGPHGEVSRQRTDIHVAPSATLVWRPEPLIAAQDCHHVNDVRVALDSGARLLLREELLLGRHGERPGTVHQRLRVRLGGQPLYQQHLTIGPGIAGWDSPAVAGNHQAIGSLVVVDPAWNDGAPPTKLLADDAARLPLAGPAVLISALAADSLALRHSLDSGLASLGPPWATDSARWDNDDQTGQRPSSASANA
jgi:urease accessory protein